MTATVQTDDYPLERSLEEYRLQLQARHHLDRIAERMLREARLGPGMRVLDMGSGMGDLALVAANMVGPSGHVTGVERDGGTLAAARRRIGELGVANVDLVEGVVTALEEVPGGPFDAAIGRLVLHYVPEPAEALRSAAAAVRPGGLVVAMEYDIVAMTSHPHVASWDRVPVLAVELFTRAGTHPRLGLELRHEFLRAGLPDPVLRGEVHVGGAPHDLAYAVAAETMRSMAPAMEAAGIATIAELELDNLEQRLRADVLAAGATVTSPLVGAAWARV